MKRTGTPAHQRKQLLCCNVMSNASPSVRLFSSASNSPSCWRGACRLTQLTTPLSPSPQTSPPLSVLPQTRCSTWGSSLSPQPSSHPQSKHGWRDTAQSRETLEIQSVFQVHLAQMWQRPLSVQNLTDAPLLGWEQLRYRQPRNQHFSLQSLLFKRFHN